MSEKSVILVTGGAGFIGGHLVDALIDKGYLVRVMDNLSHSTHNGRLPDWFNKKAEFIKGDVRKRKDWIKALAGTSVVFHLASYMDYHLDFSKYFDINLRSTALLYEIITTNKLPVKKVIIASSQSVYGEGKYLCQKHGIFYPQPRGEDQLKKHRWEVVCPKDDNIVKILPELETDALQPQTPYAISKTGSEQLSLTLGKTYEVPTTILRYSIVLGERQSFRHFYSGALRDFSVRAMAGLPIVTHEDAKQIRDFVNVHDLIDAHLLVLTSQAANYQVYNVGSGETTKILALADAVRKVTENDVRITPTKEFRINTPRSSVMNIDKLKRLGFLPKHTLRDSVDEYISWVRNYPQAIRYWEKTYKKMRQEGTLKQ